MAPLNPAARKRLAVLLALVAAGLAAEQILSPPASADSGDDMVAVKKNRPEAAPRAAATSSSGSSSGNDTRLHTEKLAVRHADAAASDLAGVALFETRTWQPPAPPAAPAPPPPPPAAPPFPYAYLGSMLDGDSRTGFFSKGERVLPVRVGDTLDAAFRVDQMTDSQMDLTYLPLEQSMTVSLVRAQ